MNEPNTPANAPGGSDRDETARGQRASGDALPAGVSVDEAGRMVIGPEALARSGIGSAADAVVETTPTGLRIVADSLRKVYVEATSMCDLACVTCIQRTWTEQPAHMPFTRYERLLDGLPGSTAGAITLAFGGFGEPLLHPDVVEMIRRARRRDLRVEITTNGTRLDARMAEALAELGVARVTVSVDGGDEESFAAVRNASLRLTLDRVARLRDVRRRRKAPLTIGLACVATRRNVRSLPALLEAARNLEVDFLWISNIVPHTAEMSRETLYERAAFLTNPAPGAWRPRVELARIDRNDLTLPLIQAIEDEVPVMPPPAIDAGAWRNRCRFAHEGMLAVASDGRVAPCLSLLRSHTEFVNGQEKAVAGLAFGNVDDAPLAGIWRAPAFRDFRQRVRSFEFPPCFGCGPCPLTETNQEDCYGDRAPVCSECLWAQGIVLCP
jgi:MoaA/NifB/PqqE/SkfB family radical SAM enzyme